MPSDYTNLCQYWTVTTESDDDGRHPPKQLGTFYGYIDDIARSLAHKCGYSLHFSSLAPLPNPVLGRGMARSVNVSFDYSTGAHSMTPEQRASYAANLFQGRPVTITKSNYYGAFVINFSPSDEESKEYRRQVILAKMSEEDRKLFE